MELLVPTQRHELTGFKKSFLGVVRPIYGQTIIDTLLTIRQVVDLNLKVDDVLITECNSCFTVLFGLHIDGDELHLGSAEEEEGRIFAELLSRLRG